MYIERVRNKIEFYCDSHYIELYLNKNKRDYKFFFGPVDVSLKKLAEYGYEISGYQKLFHPPYRKDNVFKIRIYHPAMIQNCFHFKMNFGSAITTETEFFDTLTYLFSEPVNFSMKHSVRDRTISEETEIVDEYDLLKKINEERYQRIKEFDESKIFDAIVFETIDTLEQKPVVLNAAKIERIFAEDKLAG